MTAVAIFCNASISGASISRTYDARNLMLTASRPNGVNSQNTYDGVGRVMSMTHAGSEQDSSTNETYTYDPAGNRLSSTSGIAQALITSAVTNAYDSNNEQSQFGTTANTFDANGNLASSSSSGANTTYTWDARNRLTWITSSGRQTTLIHLHRALLAI